MAQSLEISLEVSSLSAISIAILSDGALKYLWALINSSQLIAVLPLIDVPMPSNAMILFRMIAIANGDFNFMEALPNVFR